MEAKQNHTDVALFSELFGLTAQTVFRSINLSDLHLTNIEIMTMMTVYSHSGISMSSLAKAIGVSSAQLSRTVGKLEAAGLVERRHNQQNRRIVNVFHTPKGSAIVEQQTELVHANISDSLNSLSPAERTELAASFKNVIDLLVKAGFVHGNPRRAMDEHVFGDQLPDEHTEDTLPHL
ncbi:MarR family winged helix-turn-helix transcriptional regulator [Lacticaseibacillus sharpeae]|nr:MarR family transcriptional regulator [Lacticaseibacillus sharpeae]